MDEILKSKISEFIFVLYGLDINKANFIYTINNYLFQFEDEEVVIRINKVNNYSRSENLAEAYFVDDLKLFKETICEPVVSKNGHMVEEFRIGEITYFATMLRKAKGRIVTGKDFDSMFFICCGEMLGAVHKASTMQRIEGINYKRPTLLESLRDLREKNKGLIPEYINDQIAHMFANVTLSSTEVGRYGLCHGLFERASFFKDSNNIWLFDFDNCVYANYLLDVANFVLDVMIAGYKMPDCNAKKIIDLEILPFFKMGYLINKKVPSNFFEDFETYLQVAAFRKYLLFKNADDGMLNGKPVSIYTNWLEEILAESNIYEGIKITRQKQIEEIRNNLYR